MELQLDKSNIINEKRLVMLWGSCWIISIIGWSNVAIDQSLLVMIQWSYNQISPTLILKRGVQCFEDAP
jgi:hypothetical protein